MGRPRRIEPCEDCGVLTPRRGRMTDGFRCAPCAIARTGECIHQLRDKQGPFYDRYLAGMARYLMREIEKQQDPDLAGEPPYVEY